MLRPNLGSLPIVAFFGLLFDFGLILAENCFNTSNGKTVDWQSGDCVLLAHAELQTVLGPFKAASCNAAAQFELLSDFCLFWAALRLWADFAENCFVTSNARTVDWQAGDCVLSAHAELQTVLGPFKAASCNAAAQFELLSDFCLFFGLLSDFRLILAENCFVTSNARTDDLQAGDCVLLAHAELQSVLGPFEAASCNATAQFELLSNFCFFCCSTLWLRADFNWKLFCHQQCQNCWLAS
jgi:hypothetical protein